MRRAMVLGWRLLLAGIATGLVPVSTCADTAISSLQPAEDPPSDFGAPQYIDSTGCVFVRDDVLWRPRLSRDGTPVCGYPPTPVRPAALRASLPQAAPAPESMGRIEAALLATITADLRPGELTSDPRPAPSTEAANRASQDASARREASGPSAATQIAAGIASTAAIRAAAAGGDAPNTRLCALLGLAPARARGGAIGGGPTGGLCAAPEAALLVPRIAAAEAGAAGMAVVPARNNAAMPDRSARRSTAEARAPRSQPARPGNQTRGRQIPTPPSPSKAGTLIPASARYLQVSRTAGEVDALRARLAALGLPVARGRDAGGQTLLAGPFSSRKAIVTAHDRLTRAGFRNLVPR